MNAVYLVGAGCGAGSLTLRGAKLIGQCDCLVYDSLIDGGILSLAKPSCKKIFAGKRAGRHGMKQEEICALLVECGKKYALTVRLKGGDSFVFGRGGEEMLALKNAGIFAESVPGVTSAVAAAELAGIPVTHRGVSGGVHIVTAHAAEGETDFSALAKEKGTLVFLMGKASAEKIQGQLIGGGMSGNMPVALISDAGSPRQREKRGRLSDLASLAEELPAPLVIVAGEVCSMDVRARKGGGKVVVTGTEEHAERLAGCLRTNGFGTAVCPYIRIVPRDFDGALQNISGFLWLVFTSVNGVEVFFERVKETKTDLRVFGDKKFAAIGPATACALRGHGFAADLVPKEYTSEALAAALKETGVPKEKIALLRSVQGSAVLSEVGTQIGIYDTKTDEEMLLCAKDALCGADAITFSSAGGARTFLERCVLPDGILVAAIGEETARAVREFGIEPIVSERATADDLAEAVRAAKERKECRE